MKPKVIFFSLFVIVVLAWPCFPAQNQGEETAAEEEQEKPLPEPEPGFQFPQKEPMEVPQEGGITGKLADELGNPIRGVTVSAVDENGKVVAETVTDEEGRYSFRRLLAGAYTVTVDYSGISTPIEIQFEKQEKRPPIPTGLRVSEIYGGIHGKSFIRAQWDRMPGVLSYKTELREKGGKEALVQYDGILNSACEFGNLKENTDYQVRVYSENELGVSTSYALGFIRTANKQPFAPFGLGVLYAKNHRLDLFWRRVEDDAPKGYLIQVKSGKESWRYYSPEGLVTSQSEAFMVKDTGHSSIDYSITDVLENGAPIVEDGVPYSVRVLAVDETGALSAPSSAVEGIVLIDTVPPLPPSNIRHEFVSEDRLRITWETRDRDVAKFRVYYGLTPKRWDGIFYTDKFYHDLIVEREKLINKELYIAVTAIDRAGNESGYRSVEKTAEVVGGQETSQDIVLSFENIIKDLSPAIKQPPKPVKKEPVKRQIVSKVMKPKEYGIAYLARKGFVVENRETATLSGKIILPEDAIIIVNSGGTLIVNEAQLVAEKEVWGGVRYLDGAKGSVTNSTISDALNGIAVINNTDGLRFQNVVVERCAENGIFVKDSRVELKILTIRENKTGVFIQNGDVVIKGCYIEKNEKGVLAYNYRCQIEDSLFRNNIKYGLRVYGGGMVKGCIFKNNYVGVAFEQGRGAAELLESKVQNSRVDGVVVNTSELMIKKAEISGNGRNGIYVKERTNPIIIESDITSNRSYAVFGGGRITRCYVAYNNGSTYVDDTKEKGTPDDIASSSSSGVIKQIINVDYIGNLSGLSVLQ
jgi:hypothetical protein